VDVIEKATFSQVLAVPVYRTVFLTRAIAIGADTLRTVALSVLVFTATGSALLGALAFGVSFLPQVVGGLVIGALPDLIRPRPLIVTGYALEAAGATLLAIGGMPVWASLLLVAGIGCLGPVFNGTAGRLTADVLSGDAFVVGRSLFQMVASAAQVVGLAGGGLAVALVGPHTALLITAGCHVVAAVWARLALPDLPAPGRQSERSLVRQSFHGARELLVDPLVRRLLLATWLPPAFAMGAESMLIPYAALQGFPDGTAGLVLACVPVGMFVGNLVVTRALAPAARERAVPWLVMLGGLPLAGFAFDTTVPVAAVLMVCVGAGAAFSVGLQGRFRDALPEAARGQAFGLLSTGLMTLQGAAALGVAGWIAVALRPASRDSDTETPVSA
jgi:predicted MFS family arabinose efflux permease